MLDEANSANRLSIWGLFLLIALYIAGNILVRFTSTSDAVILLNHRPIPHKTLTGAFSAITNLCIITMVILYKKKGFIISLVLLLTQFPSLVNNLLNQIFTAIPGLFTNLLCIVTSCIVFTYVNKSDKYQEKMRKQATTDRMTGLPNRFAVSEMMNYLVQKKEPFTFAVIKFNNFNNINNSLGQIAGDEAIVQIAKRLKVISEGGSTGTKDFVATRKGNDFLITIRSFSSEEQVLKTIEYYAEAISKKLYVDGCDFVLTTSIGYSMFPTDANDGETIFNYAYAAMNHGRKKDHSDSICKFEKSMLNSDNYTEIERSIRHALDRGEVVFKLQPQFDTSHKLRGFEALARINDRDGNVISPVQFIPVAEKAGLVDKIDHEVLMSSTKFMGEMVRQTKTDAVLSVNASVRHLLQEGFVDEVSTALKESGLPANQLEIEITESIIIESVDKAVECIRQLNAIGVRIAIDDFGTGYSSLSYLNALPADIIKIDRSFIVNMNSSETSKQYVAAIIAIGHVMNFQVVAEGVEEDEQIETLKEINCDFIQGFIWGRPMDPKDAALLVG